MSSKVSLMTIKKAQETIKDRIRKTPIIHCPTLFNEIGNEVYFKMENLQKTGSFKIRGALNKIANLSEGEKKSGVIASSAGNHAQGVALGATSCGIKATIVMPVTAPMAKVEATRNFGAEVILHGDVYDDAYNKAREVQKETAATFLHPFDDEYVISGQGTIGLEIIDDLPDVDIVVVPIGGGGILAGIATAIKEQNPNVKVIGVQTENMPSMVEALKLGCPVEVKGTPTIADGIAVRKCGTQTFEIIEKYVDEIVTVTEDEISEAILFLLEKNKVIAEGAGATSVAAVLAGKISGKNKKICAVVSGGNIDINLLNRVMNKALLNQGRRYEIRTRIIDKAGELQKFLDVIKNNKANILFLTTNIYNENMNINSQEIKIVLECRDKEHKNIVNNALKEAGYILY